MMRRPLSLALRLTLFFGMTTAIVFAGFGWIIGRSMEKHFEAEDIKELQAIAQTVQKVLFTVQSETDFRLRARRFEDILVGHHGASLYISAADNDQTIYASPGPDLAMIEREFANGPENNAVRQWKIAAHTYRVLLQYMDENPNDSGRLFTVAVAVPIDFHLHFLDRFRYTLWLMIFSSIGLMSFMGWIAVRQGHAPLRDIVATIRRISASQLHSRLAPETVPSELADLALSFNEMLMRVEEAFQRLSNFSADIAHELRTPVTNLMTQTQVALSQSRTIDQYKEILYSNIEEYERMAQMIGDMLFLAKADNGLYKPNAINFDIGHQIRELFDYYEAWAEERGVSLSLEGTANVVGDKLMLRRALSNLLSNAIRHAPFGQNVRVVIGQSEDNSTTISIENPGEAIPPEHIPKLFDRFYRVDPSRQRSGEGAGLGLALVKSIVDAHGGDITVSSTEGSTRFVITLSSHRL